MSGRDPAQLVSRPEPGWTVLAQAGPSSYTFLMGAGDEERLKVCYFRRDRDGALVGRAWFGPRTQGPPGHAHGGSLAAVLDEAMGTSAWLAGHPALMVQLNVSFRRLVRVGTVVVLESEVVRIDGRKIHTRARLSANEGDTEPYAEAEGLLIEPKAGSVCGRGRASLHE